MQKNALNIKFILSIIHTINSLSYHKMIIETIDKIINEINNKLFNYNL